MKKKPEARYGGLRQQSPHISGRVCCWRKIRLLKPSRGAIHWVSQPKRAIYFTVSSVLVAPFFTPCATFPTPTLVPCAVLWAALLVPCAVLLAAFSVPWAVFPAAVLVALPVSLAVLFTSDATSCAKPIVQNARTHANTHANFFMTLSPFCQGLSPVSISRPAELAYSHFRVTAIISSGIILTVSISTERKLSTGRFTLLSGSPTVKPKLEYRYEGR